MSNNREGRPDSRERRSDSRAAIELSAHVHFGATTCAAAIREISESGLSFELIDVVDIPEKIKVEIESVGQKLKIPARVTWRSGDNKVFGAAYETLSEVIISSLANLLYDIQAGRSALVDRRKKERRIEVDQLRVELESHRSFLNHLSSALKIRVAVTGMGMVSPLGEKLDAVWNKLRLGESGITKAENANFQIPWPDLVWGKAHSFDAAQYLGKKKSRRMGRHSQLACAAALLAFENSGIKISSVGSQRMGVYLGTSLGGMNDILTQHKVFLSRGIEKVKPFEWLGGSVGDSTAEISLLLKLRGPSHTICTGSASSADAIGYGFRAIQSGNLDAVIVGGAEAPLFLEMLSLFQRTGVLAIDNAAPLEAMKPFDSRRSGFVLGEGAAFVVLENMERAIRRNAVIHGEIAGYGNSCDSHHAFASDPLGREMAGAIQQVLKDSGIPATDMDYVNVHGTGTVVGDSSETRALKRAFGKDANRISLSSTKPFTGHLLGAAGAVETIFTLLAMQNDMIPPTLNLKQQDGESNLDFTPLHSRKRTIRSAMSINSGFGGKNSVLAFKIRDGIKMF